MRAALARALSGDGSVLLVEGETGIGKTRLLDEFLREEVSGNAVVLYGACFPLGGNGGIPESIVSHLGGADLRFAEAQIRRWFLSRARATAGHPVLLLATANTGIPESELAMFPSLGNSRRLSLARLGARDVVALIRETFKSDALTDRLGAKIFLEIGDRMNEGAAEGNLGNVYTDLGLFDQAQVHLLRAVLIAREIGDRPHEGITLINHGSLRLLLGGRGHRSPARRARDDRARPRPPRGPPRRERRGGGAVSSELRRPPGDGGPHEGPMSPVSCDRGRSAPRGIPEASEAPPDPRARGEPGQPHRGGSPAP